jgi:putative pyruvate formate lyase activating enzyme
MVKEFSPAAARTESEFMIPAESFEPAYLTLYRSGELAKRAVVAVAELADCRLCPRNCGINRLADKTAACLTGRKAVVASSGPHFGEEDCLRGRHGSGTIFFSNCNLRCVFCQNFDISQKKAGREVSAGELADMMLRLQRLGCHNINFVTPEHVVPQILEALTIAVDGGLRLPVVYNTSAYDSLESLRLMDGIIDIYMPDFKIWDSRLAMRYLKAANYPESARQVLREMYRQVGVLKFDEAGLAKRGVLVRHLVMPGGVAGTADIMKFLADELSPDTYVNMMDQYHPAGKVGRREGRLPDYDEINRRVMSYEMQAAFETAAAAGLWRFDERGFRF